MCTQTEVHIWRAVWLLGLRVFYTWNVQIALCLSVCQDVCPDTCFAAVISWLYLQLMLCDSFVSRFFVALNWAVPWMVVCTVSSPALKGESPLGDGSPLSIMGLLPPIAISHYVNKAEGWLQRGRNECLLISVHQLLASAVISVNAIGQLDTQTSSTSFPSCRSVSGTHAERKSGSPSIMVVLRALLHPAHNRETWFIAILCEGTLYSYAELQLRQKESHQSSGRASVACTTCKSNTEIFIEAKLFFVTVQIVYEQGVNCTVAYSNEVLH